MTATHPRLRSTALAGALLVVMFLLSAFASTAAAATALQVNIREATLEPSGEVQLVVSARGAAVDSTLSAEDFTVTEAGNKVADLTVEPLLDSNSQPVVVALTMDVSGSLAGQPMLDAQAAARAFVQQLPSQVAVALVTFGSTAELRSGFTTDRGAITGIINGLQAKGETALYDGIALAAETLGSSNGQRNIVVFSDGKDSISRTSLDQAVARAKDVKAPITVVGLQSGDFDPGSISSIAEQTGGSNLPVGDSTALAGAFQQVAKEISSQYVVTYSSTRLQPKDLDLVVRVNAAGTSASDTVTVPNPRVQGGAGEEGGVVETTEPGLLTSKAAYYGGILAAFVAVMLLVGVLFWRPGSGRAAQVLKKGLSLYTRGARGTESKAEGGLAGSAIAQRANELVGRLPASKTYLQKLQEKLDRSGWPLRSTELVLLQVMGVVGGFIIGAGLFRRIWLGILMALFGLIVPQVILNSKINRRNTAFLSQLPDTLQLLAASLQAGYGLMQAIDTVAKESEAPTSVEFARVLAEARLGMPVDEAMTAMAERVGGEDFKWVVLAINIQRQVGGNLAQLLQTVADTLREREQVRRQVKVLSAEGRLSAIVLLALPFLLVGYLLFSNPNFLQPLITTFIGNLMVIGAVLLMVAGTFWMRKLIRIDV